MKYIIRRFAIHPPPQGWRYLCELNMKQTFTSKRTSINSGKIPKAYTIYEEKYGGFRPGSTILDYGGGKFDNAVHYMAKKGCNVMIYDPYNRTVLHNNKVLSHFRHHAPDYIICCNVLNIIKEDEIVEKTIAKIKRLSDRHTVVIFKIWPGNRLGRGMATGDDQWQRNQKLEEYLPVIKKYFPNAEKKYDLIVA